MHSVRFCVNGILYYLYICIVHATIFIFIAEANDPGCGGTITTPGTVFSSTNYPENYPNSEDCTRIIRFGAGQTVSLEFLHFNLEGHATCA